MQDTIIENNASHPTVQVQKKSRDATILHYRNMCSITVCTTVLCNLIWVHFYGTFQAASIPIIFLQLIVDLQFSSNDAMIHHLIGIVLCGCYYNANIHPEYIWHVTKCVYKTEISTYFYVFRFLLKNDEYAFTRWLLPSQKAVLQKANDIAFYLTFYKFRIYDYTNEIILNVDGYRRIVEYTDGAPISRAIFYPCLVVLYLLNIYWFTIMTKLLLKPHLTCFLVALYHH